MRKKIYNGKLKSLTETGQFEAVIATLNTVDKDGDLIKPGAIPQGTKVRIASWGHKWNELPVGKGTLYEGGNVIAVKGQFFLDTEGGKETYKTVKNLGELQEWSFGFDVVDSHWDQINGKQVRVLDRLDVYEVSPVLIGAGVGTRTTDIKARKQKTKKPWRLEALDQMVEQERRKEAGWDYAKRVIRELKRMQDETQPTRKKSPMTPLEQTARRIQQQRDTTREWALRLARDHFLDQARQRLINRGIDPHENPVELQREEQRVLQWAITPQEG